MRPLDRLTVRQDGEKRERKRERERERERVKLSTYLRPSYLTVDRSERILPIT